ncbi:MAG: flagellar hook-length control protein FliK [Phycisphaeraceae bacterium]|nr:flagellar hook-length control protein FliK [Phycisphaeraceae bacterium]
MNQVVSSPLRTSVVAPLAQKLRVATPSTSGSSAPAEPAISQKEKNQHGDASALFAQVLADRTPSSHHPVERRPDSATGSTPSTSRPFAGDPASHRHGADVADPLDVQAPVATSAAPAASDPEPSVAPAPDDATVNPLSQDGDSTQVLDGQAAPSASASGEQFPLGSAAVSPDPATLTTSVSDVTPPQSAQSLPAQAAVDVPQIVESSQPLVSESPTTEALSAQAPKLDPPADADTPPRDTSQPSNRPNHVSSKPSQAPAPILAVATPGRPFDADSNSNTTTQAKSNGSSGPTTPSAHAIDSPSASAPAQPADASSQASSQTSGHAHAASAHNVTGAGGVSPTNADAALTSLFSTPFASDAGAKDALAQAQPLPASASADGYGTDEQANLSRVVRGLSAAVNQKGGAVTLRLSPPELGLVRIQMQVRDGVVRAEVFTEHASARSLLADGLTELRQALQSHGLSVDRLGVQTMTTSSSNPWSESSARMNAGQDGGRSRGSFSQEPGRQDHPSGRSDRETPDFDSQLTQAGV